MTTLRDTAAAQRTVAELQLSGSRNLAIAQGLYGTMANLSAAALALADERDALRRELSARSDSVAQLLRMTVLLEATQQRLEATEQWLAHVSQKLDEATRQYVEAERLKDQASLQVTSARRCLESIEQRAVAFAEQVRTVSQTGGDSAALIGGFAQSFAQEVLARVDWALSTGVAEIDHMQGGLVSPSANVAQLSNVQQASVALDGQESRPARAEERNQALVEDTGQHRVTENRDDRDETVEFEDLPTRSSPRSPEADPVRGRPPVAEGETITRSAFARTTMQSPEMFFSHWWPRLLRFLISQARNPSLAEDVASETFLSAWEHWDLLLTYDRPDSWLIKVALRKLRRLEAKAREQSFLDDNLPSIEADLRVAASSSELVANHLDLVAALRSLPRRQAEVVALRWLQGFTVNETAEILGITEETARRQLSRAGKKLAHLLQPDAVGPMVVQAELEPSGTESTTRVSAAVQY